MKNLHLLLHRHKNWLPMETYSPSNPTIRLDEFIRRVRWYITLRWVYIGLLTLISTGILWIVQGFSVETARNLEIGIAALIYNALLMGLSHVPLRRFYYFRILAFLAIYFDILLAAFVIQTHGGIQSRAIILLAIPIFVAGALFGRFASYFTASLCGVIYGAVIVQIANGKIVSQNISIANSPNSVPYIVYSIAFYSAVFLVLALISDFLLGLHRQREQTKARTELVALASHELRTPATAVSGLLEMAQEESKNLSPAGQHYIEQAYLENKRELLLIENLLAVARLDAGEFEIAVGAIDATKIVKTQIEHFMPFFAASNQKVQTEIAQGINVFADEDFLGLAITNLLSNANRFSPEGASVDVRLFEFGEQVELHVKDNGAGIDHAIQKAIFERFSKASEQTGGAGLGLYLARNIARLCGGDLTVKSAPGQGSDFILQLPYKRED